MSLIAGLGNPGRKYAGTRHNVGFELIDRLAEKLSVSIESADGLFLHGGKTFKGDQTHLIKPLTYMNRSGQAIAKAIRLFSTPLDRVLVCYDDINLPIGKIRLRPHGSAGGHNGLGDIMEALHTDKIPRLKIGIGNNFDRGHQSDYVLSGFNPEERLQMDETLDRAVEAVFTFMREGITQAMNRHN